MQLRVEKKKPEILLGWSCCVHWTERERQRKGGGGGAHRELVQRVVAKLAGGEEEARLEHADGGARRQGVEVLDLDLRHRLLVVQ